MKKRVRNTIVFLLFSVILFSCSSAPNSEATATPPESESNENLRASRARETADDRMVAYTATLNLSVKNTEETRSKLIEYTKSNDGFIIRETDDFITSRIPAKNMDNFISESKTLGKIENESKTGTDITDQYRDNVIRLDNLKSIRDRYLALLERANTINDILTIEKELQRVVLEIERLEGMIKNAELSVAYSSVTVRFREKAKPGPVGWIFYGLYRGVKWLFVWK